MLQVTGHFSPIHDWEKLKPAETMWLGVEAWDDLAKSIYVDYSKGSKLAGVGLLLLNKWKDKATGEDRKQFKLRLTKVMLEDELRSLLGEIEDLTSEDTPWEEEVFEEDSSPPPPRKGASSVNPVSRSSAQVTKNPQEPPMPSPRPKIRF